MHAHHKAYKILPYQHLISKNKSDSSSVINSVPETNSTEPWFLTQSVLGYSPCLSSLKLEEKSFINWTFTENLDSYKNHNSPWLYNPSIMQ